MKKIIKTILYPLPLLLIPYAALAQSPQPVDPREVCRDDIHAFCGNVRPGSGRVVNCLEDNYKDLSDSCYNILQKTPQPGDGPNDDIMPRPPQIGGNGMQPPPPPPSGGYGMQPPPPPPNNGGYEMQPPPPPNGGYGMQPPPPPSGQGYEGIPEDGHGIPPLPPSPQNN